MSKTSQTLTLTILIACVIFVFGTPFAVYAQNFVPLTGIPGVDVNNTDLVGYINALYILAVALGALFAVVKIGVAGTKYAMSDIVTDKESAKKDIYGALIGLAILLATYIVLYTIDPRLTSLNILGNAQPGTLSSPSQGIAAAPAAPGTTSAVGAVNCGNQAKYTDDDGVVRCGTAANVDPASSVPVPQQLQSAADQCKASGGTLQPRNVQVTKPNAQGVPTRTIERQFVCVKP